MSKCNPDRQKRATDLTIHCSGVIYFVCMRMAKSLFPCIWLRMPDSGP